MKTPKELSLLIAANVRKRRKGQKLSMQDLSDKSGVSYGSIKRFESIGEISLTSLLKSLLCWIVRTASSSCSRKRKYARYRRS